MCRLTARVSRRRYVSRTYITYNSLGFERLGRKDPDVNMRQWIFRGLCSLLLCRHSCGISACRLAVASICPFGDGRFLLSGDWSCRRHRRRHRSGRTRSPHLRSEHGYREVREGGLTDYCVVIILYHLPAFRRQLFMSATVCHVSVV